MTDTQPIPARCRDCGHEISGYNTTIRYPHTPIFCEGCWHERTRQNRKREDEAEALIRAIQSLETLVEKWPEGTDARHLAEVIQGYCDRVGVAYDQTQRIPEMDRAEISMITGRATLGIFV